VTLEPKTSKLETEASDLDSHPSGPTDSPAQPSQGQQATEPNSHSAEVAAATGETEDQFRQEAARLKDQLLRLAADFDNFRKRSRREIADAERMAREDLLRELLPVFDNLERASQHAGTVTEVQALVDGLSMVSRLFVDTLSRLGVERVATVGVSFDPAVHEAVQQIETTEQPAGSVYAEILAGYRFGERLIRPAMVVVAKAPASA
jgi:molecular chaperone GrpE